MIRPLFNWRTALAIIAIAIVSGTIIYSYQLEGLDLPITIPVTLIPSSAIIPNEKGQQLADQLSNMLQNWLQSTQPDSNRGQFLFTINIFSFVNPKVQKLQLSLSLAMTDFMI